MNTKQKNKVISIIKKTSFTAGCYLDSDGKSCVLGTLALEAGFPREKLVKKNNSEIGDFPELVFFLEDTYDLDIDNLRELQFNNDNEDDENDSRRKNLILEYIYNL